MTLRKVFQDILQAAILYAVLIVCIIVSTLVMVATASGAEPPRYTVESKLPVYTVTNRLPPTATGVVVHQPAQPRREYWQGYGWVEWRDGSWWAVQAAPEVAARPFQPGYPTTPRTSANNAAGALTSYPAGYLAGTSTHAQWGIAGGIENCASPFG